jgi:predicted membrane protein
MSLMGLESIINGGIMNIVGDPLMAGLLVLGFFVLFVLIQGTRLDAKIAIIVPAGILSLAFAPVLIVILGFAFGVILYLTFTKLTNK